MPKPNFTLQPFELQNGETVDLAVSFYLLAQLKARKPELYTRFNKIMTQGVTDIFDSPLILYVGYVCALIAKDELDAAMSEDDFLIALGDDYSIFNAATKLVSTKKKAISATPS